MFLNLRPLLEDMCTKKLSALQLCFEYLRGMGGGLLVSEGGFLETSSSRLEIIRGGWLIRTFTVVNRMIPLLQILYKWQIRAIISEV